MEATDHKKTDSADGVSESIKEIEGAEQNASKAIERERRKIDEELKAAREGAAREISDATARARADREARIARAVAEMGRKREQILSDARSRAASMSKRSLGAGAIARIVRDLQKRAME
jgi:vacuolar-type H+-ATPase subunit H